MISLDALREYSRGSLWLLPTIAVALAMLLGILISQIDVGPNSPLAFQGTADDARSNGAAVPWLWCLLTTAYDSKQRPFLDWGSG